MQECEIAYHSVDFLVHIFHDAQRQAQRSAVRNLNDPQRAHEACHQRQHRSNSKTDLRRRISGF